MAILKDTQVNGDLNVIGSLIVNSNISSSTDDTSIVFKSPIQLYSKADPNYPKITSNDHGGLTLYACDSALSNVELGNTKAKISVGEGEDSKGWISLYATGTKYNQLNFNSDALFPASGSTITLGTSTNLFSQVNATELSLGAVSEPGSLIISTSDNALNTQFRIDGNADTLHFGYYRANTYQEERGTLKSYKLECSILNSTAQINSKDIKFSGSIKPADNIEGTMIQAHTFSAVSDARLKENFQVLISKKSILDLPTYKFDFINGSKNQIGCKAQDLQEICPEIVDEGNDGYLSIQESKIVYLLLEEVKKLRKEIDDLKVLK